MADREIQTKQKRLAEFEEKGLDAGDESPEDLAALEGKLQEALEDVRARRKSSGNSKK